MTTVQITVTVNGEEQTAEVEPRLLLVHFIRETLSLTGNSHRLRYDALRRMHHHYGWRPVKSCTIFAVQANGRAVSTVEGLEQDGALHPIQEAFTEEHGLQCGFCTPGMMMTGVTFCKTIPIHPMMRFGRPFQATCAVARGT